jgi:hypothetical protein
MKRRVVNLGIFSADVCTGRAVADDEARGIYGCLKSLGFRETRWQFVYDGQRGGLVLPYNDGLNEIHVRFYDDRIFAELEYSRSSLFHFVFPLFNANSFLAELLKDRLPPKAHERLVASLGTNLRDDEAALAHWRPGAEVNPYDGLLRERTAWQISSFLHRIFGWRAVVTLVLTGAVGVSLLLPVPAIALAAIAAITFGLLFWIPSIGRP